MRCICLKDCFLKHESDRPSFYSRGDQVEFETCPSHFAPLEEAFVPQEDAPQLPKAAIMSGVKPESGAFDFGTASEELLMAGTYEVADLIAYAKANYAVDLPAGEEKATTVARFVDARYRVAVTKAGLDAATTNIIK